MKTARFMSFLLGSALACVPAVAADMYNTPLRGTYAPVAAATDSAGWTGWEGPYGGVYGGLPTNSQLTLSPAALLQPYITGTYRTRMSGGSIGGLAGFNLQSGSFVYGAEADLGFSHLTAKEGASIGSLTAGARLSANFLATARARAGVAFGRLMAYATGGVAVTTLKATAFATSSGESIFEYKNSQTVTGLALGAGFEYALTDKLNARGEYLYTSFGRATYADAVNAKLNAGFARMAIIGKF